LDGCMRRSGGVWHISSYGVNSRKTRQKKRTPRRACNFGVVHPAGCLSVRNVVLCSHGGRLPCFAGLSLN
jgi:hypothetical protein